MKLALVVLIGLVLEIFVWIGVGDLVGSMWYVFFWFIAAFFIGLNLVRANAKGLMPQMQQMQMGQMSSDPQFSNNLPKILAGILLIIPGLITDLFALLILIPPVQRLFKQMIMNTMLKRQQAMMNKMMGGMMGDAGNNGGQAGQNPFADLMKQMQDMQNQQGGSPYNDSNVIDGEAHEVEPDRKQIPLKDVNKK